MAKNLQMAAFMASLLVWLEPFGSSRGLNHHLSPSPWLRARQRLHGGQLSDAAQVENEVVERDVAVLRWLRVDRYTQIITIDLNVCIHMYI